MHALRFYLDFVSPYAWLAFARLPQLLEGLSVHVEYRPVLLGALLQQHANPGPAGIAPKRDWTYRHACWLGHALDVPLQMPARHPFTPLPLLRLALTCGDGGRVNRFVADQVFRHVWAEGGDALDPARLAALQQRLAGQRRTGDAAPEQARQWLRANTEQAAAAGVFGVPMVEAGGKLFWGLDGLPMLRAFLDGDPWFAGDGWQQAATVPSGLPGVPS